MILGIDWNNTIQDMIGELVHQANGHLCREDFDKWDVPLGKVLGISDKDFINWCWKNEKIQMYALPFPGVKQALDKMRAKDWKIKIITSSFMPISKIMWWFDFYQIPYDEIIKTKDKSEVMFDLLIDDNPDVIDQMLILGRPVVKFSLPWNQYINCLGFSDWRIL